MSPDQHGGVALIVEDHEAVMEVRLRLRMAIASASVEQLLEVWRAGLRAGLPLECPPGFPHDQLAHRPVEAG